ncbi:hypothetical protein QQ045_014058 [Rhodiola kirilowii]
MAKSEIAVTCDIIDVEELVKQLCSNKHLAEQFVFNLRNPPPDVNDPEPNRPIFPPVAPRKPRTSRLRKRPSHPVGDSSAYASPPPPPVKVNTTEEKELAVAAPPPPQLKDDKEADEPPCPSDLVSGQFKGLQIGITEQVPDIKLTTEPDAQSRKPYPFDLNKPPSWEKDEDTGAAVPPSSLN